MGYNSDLRNFRLGMSNRVASRCAVGPHADQAEPVPWPKRLSWERRGSDRAATYVLCAYWGAVGNMVPEPAKTFLCRTRAGVAELAKRHDVNVWCPCVDSHSRLLLLLRCAHLSHQLDLQQLLRKRNSSSPEYYTRGQPIGATQCRRSLVSDI